MNKFLIVAAVVAALCVTDVFSAPVKVFCRQFVGDKPVTNTPFTWLENGTTFVSDDNGNFFFDAAVGSLVTINFTGNEEFQPLQSVTVTVPEGGLTSITDEIVMQMPSRLIYEAFRLVMPGGNEMNTSCCQVVVTVCNVNKTSYSFPQGLPGTEVLLSPPLQTRTFFFGTWGNLSNMTNPFPNDLNTTSWDGGVVFENVPMIPDQWYTVSAYHKGYTFSTTRFRCSQEGLLINGAPNQGPRAVPNPGTW